MNSDKRAAKEAIIAIINDQLDKPQNLRCQVYLTERKEKHENDLRKEEILRAPEKRFINSFIRRSSKLN